jgi:perosamine synthetase
MPSGPLCAKNSLKPILIEAKVISMTIPNPYGKFIGNELKYISEFLDSENPGNKAVPWATRFEKAFAERLGIRYAIAHNSGTSTLHSCLAAADVRQGDEVIIPAQTVAMLAFVTLAQKAVPVFADVDPGTFNISPVDVASKITEKTKAIIAVHMHGLPADMDPIMEIGRKFNLPVIEDSAQCVLGYYKGRLSGTIGDMASFSFEAKKHLSIGEAGMVVSDHAEFAAKIRKFGGLGYKMLSADAGMRQVLPTDFQNPAYKRHDTIGLNYRMPDVCGALGLAQLERVEDLVGRRQKIAGFFLEAVKGCDWIVPQCVPQGYVHSYWTFTVRYRGEDAHNVSWRRFYELYLKNGGDGFYGGLSLIYQEPFMQTVKAFNEHLRSRYPTVGDKFVYDLGMCPAAEALQPQMMQFKTNYRNLEIARQKADALFETIKEIEG